MFPSSVSQQAIDEAMAANFLYDHRTGHWVKGTWNAEQKEWEPGAQKIKAFGPHLKGAG